VDQQVQREERGQVGERAGCQHACGDQREQQVADARGELAAGDRDLLAGQALRGCRPTHPQRRARRGRSPRRGLGVLSAAGGG
jgi:hypothetical protein